MGQKNLNNPRRTFNRISKFYGTNFYKEAPLFENAKDSKYYFEKIGFTNLLNISNKCHKHGRDYTDFC